MKLQFLILLFTVFVLFVVWRSRLKISCLPPNQEVHLLSASYRLCLLLLLSGVIVSLLIAMLSGDIYQTTIGYLHGYINTLTEGRDSWMAMQKAIEQLRKYPDTPVYSELFFKHKIKFQYPPSSLLFLDFPQRITGCSWGSLFNAINLICWFCLPAIAVVFCSLFTGAALSPNINKDIHLPISSLALLTLMSLALVGSFYPILRSYNLGQIQTPLTLFAGLALLAWQQQQFGLAGFFIGLCCGIKPQWLVIIPWAILRQQWRMVSVATVTLGILLSLSIAAYGVSNIVDYFPVLSFLSRHGECFYANQSVNGLLNRLLFNGNNLNFTDAFPSVHPLVYAFTIGSSILILGFAMFWRMIKDPSIFDLALIMLSLTIASPIAWEHHYGILLPIFAIVLPTAISQRSLGVWTTAYLWFAFILTSQKFDEITNLLASTHWNVLQSYLFFGAIMMMILLYRITYLQQRVRYEEA